VVYKLENVYHENVNKANEAIKCANDLSNDLTKQLFPLTTFFLMFAFSFSYLLKDVPMGKIRCIMILGIIFSVLSILSGLFSMIDASRFFIKKAREYHQQAIKTQDYITENNQTESDNLPYKYDVSKGPEASLMEIILCWGQICFFILSIGSFSVVIVGLLVR
jgi:hypothetical protein